MTPEETLQSRLRIATASAAAAITVALGVTVAALSGYLPTPIASSPEAAATGPVAAESATASVATASVATEPIVAPTPSAAIEQVLASERSATPAGSRAAQQTIVLVPVQPSAAPAAPPIVALADDSAWALADAPGADSAWADDARVYREERGDDDDHGRHEREEEEDDDD